MAFPAEFVVKTLPGIGRVIFFFQAEDGIRDVAVTGVQTCALPIWFFLPLGELSPREKRAHSDRTGSAPSSDFSLWKRRIPLPVFPPFRRPSAAKSAAPRRPAGARAASEQPFSQPLPEASRAPASRWRRSGPLRRPRGDRRSPAAPSPPPVGRPERRAPRRPARSSAAPGRPRETASRAPRPAARDRAHCGAGTRRRAGLALARAPVMRGSET